MGSALQRSGKSAPGDTRRSGAEASVCPPAAAPRGAKCLLAALAPPRLRGCVGGARWRPRYDLRGDAATGEVELALSAMVSQTTGEDWSGAALTLSTAQPSLGVTAPELEPFWLYEQHAGYAYGRGAGVLNAPVMVAPLPPRPSPYRGLLLPRSLPRLRLLNPPRNYRFFNIF